MEVFEASPRASSPVGTIATFDNSFDAEQPSKPARVPVAKSKRKRYLSEHDEALRPEGAEVIDDEVETDLFDLFSAALTRLHSEWDPVAELFRLVDDDGSGELELPEVKLALHGKLNGRELKQAFAEMDEDGGGSIDIDEFRDWWNKCVISPTGQFHDRLGNMSREECRQQMRKCFEEPELRSGDRSPFVLQGQQFLVPLPAADFWESVQGHLELEISSADRAQLVEQLVADRTKLPNGEQDRAEEYSIGELLDWWDRFFEFDSVDPYAMAMRKINEDRTIVNPLLKFRGDCTFHQPVHAYNIVHGVDLLSMNADFVVRVDWAGCRGFDTVRHADLHRCIRAVSSRL